MSVERESGFDAEGVAGAESAGFDASFDEGVPEVGGFGCAADEFKSIFAGVSRSGGEGGDASDFDSGGAEKCESFEVFVLLREGVDEFCGLWPLDSDHGGLAGLVGH